MAFSSRFRVLKSPRPFWKEFIEMLVISVALIVDIVDKPTAFIGP